MYNTLFGVLHAIWCIPCYLVYSTLFPWLSTRKQDTDEVILEIA